MINGNYNPDIIYKYIGEFVMSFQWLEHRLREIGWLIIDPTRSEWLPRGLREETNYELVNKVTKLYMDLIDTLKVENAEELKSDFRSISEDCHRIRQKRNRLLHSAFIELSTNNISYGIVRNDPRLETDPVTGEILFDIELLTEASFEASLKEIGELAVRTNRHYIQLIHWAPFELT